MGVTSDHFPDIFRRASAKLGSALAHVIASIPTPEAMVAKPCIPTLLAGPTLWRLSRKLLCVCVCVCVWGGGEVVLGVGPELSL